MISLLLGLSACLGAGPIVCAGPTLGLPAAIVALVSASKAYARHRSDPVQPIGRPSFQIWGGIAASTMVLLAHLALALTLLSATREVAKSAVTAANLRSIGQALHAYHRDHGDYPPSRAPLLASGSVTQNQFRSRGDPTPYETLAGDPSYQSLVYQPGVGEWQSDSKLILALEREPWSRGELRLRNPCGRYVLFADQQVRWLQGKAFERARFEDARRRNELNWPPPERVE